MVQKSADIAEQILAACRQGSARVAAALSSAFEAEITLGSPQLGPAASKTNAAAPGLIMTCWADLGAVLLLSGDEGLLPAWCAAPDHSTRERLQILAKELAGHLLPEAFASAAIEAAWSPDLATALAAVGPAETVRTVSMAVASGSLTGVLSILAPVVRKIPENQVTRSAADFAAPPLTALPQERIVYERIEEALPYLPVYSRSLLRIKVPVRVTLASTRLPVRKIVELSPGTLIQFSKLCEDPLDLEVGQRPVARGEAVKIGEKFGLRITSIVLPGERFVSLAPKR